MNMKRPTLLISNDDGYLSKGINSLIGMLRPLADLVVVAPDGPRSGYACAFSADKPLRLQLQCEQEGLRIYSCNGTPVDCVKLALHEFFSTQKPDMVIGGINHGDNASVNSHYSGTMGVAMEGCMKYIPSVAFSICSHDPDADFEPMRPIVTHIVGRVLQQGLPKGVCLNVNMPATGQVKGLKVSRMAFGSWNGECVKHQHPHGYEYYWLTGHYTNDEPQSTDNDNYWLTHGYATITPTRMDVTAYDAIEQLSHWTLP